MADKSIPIYWTEYLDKKICTINTLQEKSGEGSYSFVVISDMHYPKNAGHSPHLIKKIIKETSANYALCLGDVQTSWCHDIIEQVYDENKLIDDLLEPIRGSLLITEGNHDGCYGWLDRDGDGEFNNILSDGDVKPPHLRETYVNNLTPEEMYDSIYSKVAKSVGGLIFAEGDSHGYWVDDADNKTRFILLNICNCRYELQEDGTPLYPKMWIFRFGQEQIDMVTEALTSVPADDWSVVVAAHNAPDKSVIDGDIMLGVLNSYICKTTYSATTKTSYGDVVCAECDFTCAKGELIGYFYGHIHKDTDKVSDGVTMISTTCDAIEDIDLSLRESRSKDSVSEHSFDVFTIDRYKKILYATRIGSGEDRIIKYM